jgi:hypothetical protein
LVRFLSPRPAKTTYASNDAVSRKEVPFAGPNAYKHFQGVHFLPKFRPGIGISSLNKTINNCSTLHAIFAQISSIGAAWQIHPKSSTAPQNFGLGSLFGEKRPPKGISSQNTLLNNFSSVQPILTCNNQWIQLN